MVNCLIFSVCYFWLRKKSCYQNVCSIKKWMMLEIINKNVSEIMTMPNNLILAWRFKTIILCFFHSVRLMKYVFYAKIWFMKTSTRIVKSESQVVKSNRVAHSQKYYMITQIYIGYWYVTQMINYYVRVQIQLL